LVNVSTEINTAAFLHEAGIPESFQYVESGAGAGAERSTTSGVSQRALRNIVPPSQKMAAMGKLSP
jgi:hypothetical protein